jgi:hypothetical protein
MMEDDDIVPVCHIKHGTGTFIKQIGIKATWTQCLYALLQQFATRFYIVTQF